MKTENKKQETVYINKNWFFIFNLVFENVCESRKLNQTKTRCTNSFQTKDGS